VADTRSFCELASYSLTHHTSHSTPLTSWPYESASTTVVNRSVSIHLCFVWRLHTEHEAHIPLSRIHVVQCLANGHQVNHGWSSRNGWLEVSGDTVLDPRASDLYHDRWLFVINAIMTVALGLAGFIMIPNWPDKPNPWAIWMKPHHYEIALARTARFKRASNKKFTWSTVKRSVKLPLFYLIPCLYVATVLAQAGYQCEYNSLHAFYPQLY
jgi:hypothetical protein